MGFDTVNGKERIADLGLGGQECGKIISQK